MTKRHPTHAELVDLAGRWLKGQRNCRIVLQEPRSLSQQLPDAIGYQNHITYMVECKTSRADFFADRKKAHWGSPCAQASFYLVPHGLVSPDEVPDPWGLLYTDGKYVSRIEQAKPPVWLPDGNNDQMKAMFLYKLATDNGLAGRYSSQGHRLNPPKADPHPCEGYIRAAKQLHRAVEAGELTAEGFLTLARRLLAQAERSMEGG